MAITELRKKSKQVEKVFAELDNQSAKYLIESGVSCPSGCGKCCFNKDITASVLEFLPFALSLYDNGELEARYWEYKQDMSEGCVLYSHAGGLVGQCSQYQKRGLICRLFGNAAMTDKNGDKKFLGCSILKAQAAQKVDFNMAVTNFAPLTANYYMQLRGIDINNGSLYLPVNMAILKAMEIVFMNSRHRLKRSS